MTNYYFKKIPRSRIATFDVYSVAQHKHHVAIMLECDVTEARLKLNQAKSTGQQLSFTGWLLKIIGQSVEAYPEVAAYPFNKKKLIIFNDVNIALAVEKEINGKLVPIPLVINKTNEKNPLEITLEIEKAKEKNLSGKDIVLNKKSRLTEQLYYFLPAIIRKSFWRWMLNNPKIAYHKMGNVMVTSVGMMGQVNGWFIHKSVHPLSFGIGSIIKKPRAMNGEVQIREILNITVLIDHDAIDGAPMARFIQHLVSTMETAKGI